MRKIFPLYKVCATFIVLCSLFIQPSFSQSNPEIGLPLITNYPTSLYGGNGQVWSIIQGDDGIMYFGTSSEIMEFDGINWRQIRLTDNLTGAAIRGMAKADNGTIFYGSSGSFGYLKKDRLGNMQLQSLKSIIPSEYRDFEDIWSVQVLDGYVYFQSREYLFRISDDVESTKKEVEVWEPEQAFSHGFVIHGEYLIHEIRTGISRMVDGNLEPFHGTEVLTGDRLFTVLPFSDNSKTGKKQFLLGRFYQDLHIYDGDKITPFKSDLNQYLSDNLIYKSTRLPNGNYAVSAIGLGLVILDPQGGLVSILSSKDGLQDPSIYSVYVDDTGILWVGLEKGISKIELSSQISAFTQQSGIPSTVYNIARAGDDLYISTPVGLYQFIPERRLFEPMLEAGNSQIFTLLVDDKDLIVPGQGLHVVRDGKFVQKELSIESVGQDLLMPKDRPDLLYVSTSPGVKVFLKQNDKWRDLGAIGGMSKSIWSLAESSEGAIWAGSQNGIAYRITPAFNDMGFPELANFEVKQYGPGGDWKNAAGLVYNVGGEIFIPALGGMLKYNPETDRIEPDNSLGEIPLDAELSENFFIEEDLLGNVWMPIRNKIRRATPLAGGGYRLEDDLFNAYPWQSMYTIYPEENGIVWVGSGEGLIRFDQNIEAQGTNKFR